MLRVLVVDDSRDSRESLAMVLRVYHAFERTQADSPGQRWVVVGAEESVGKTEASAADSSVPVEPTPEEPAA